LENKWKMKVVAGKFEVTTFGLRERSYLSVFAEKGKLGPVDIVRFAEAFGAKGLRIRHPDEISSTRKKALAMQGPVLVGVPLDYRDNHRLMEIVHPEALN
jgi:thiamine pyrophosphate-dependent acetolactate synthase large subunit-like protein